MVCINIVSLNGNVLVTTSIEQDVLLSTLMDQAMAALGVRGSCNLVLPGVGVLGGKETAASLHLSDEATILAVASGVSARQITMPYTWARQLLESIPTCRQRAARERFQKFDVSRTGTLSLEELVALTADLCEFLGLDQPEAGKLRTLFDRCDKNHDAVLQEQEFVKFFEAYLKFALPRLDVIERKTEEDYIEDQAKVTNDAKEVYERWLESKAGKAHLLEIHEKERVAREAAEGAYHWDSDEFDEFMEEQERAEAKKKRGEQLRSKLDEKLGSGKTH